MPHRTVVALTIAGSDSGAGAGVQADLKTFAAHQVYGASAITAVTAQNTLGVTGVHELPLDIIAAQIDAVVSDLGVDAVKTGMLSSTEIIGAVAERLRAHGLTRIVVDPVMVAKGGDRLLREDAVEALVSELLPLALVATPNADEAEALTGSPVASVADAKRAAAAIRAMGPRYVVVKGGTSATKPWTSSTTARVTPSSRPRAWPRPARTAPVAPSRPRSLQVSRRARRSKRR